MSVSQESLRESSSQVTLLQQRERESEERERQSEIERARERDRSGRALSELEAKVQTLAEQGLVRTERSPSGHLEVQVVPVVQCEIQKGQRFLFGFPEGSS